MVSNKVKKLSCGVFIDGSNLYGGQKEAGWWIDFNILKKHLKKHFKPAFFNYYGGVDILPNGEIFKKKAKSQKRFYSKLNGWGYNVITKPLKYMKIEDGVKTKCDMDVEISTDMITTKDIDLFILFTGDSDYLHCIKRLHENDKYIRVYSFKDRLSWELKDFSVKNPRCNYKLLDDMKDELIYEKELDNN